MALSSSLAPSGNATASIDGLVAPSCRRPYRSKWKPAGSSDRPDRLVRSCSRPNQATQMRKSEQAQPQARLLRRRQSICHAKRNSAYQTCLSFFHSHKTRNHPLKVMESSSRNGFQRNVCATSTPPANVLSQNLRIVGDMAKTSSQFLCSECGWSGPKWLGRCPECGQWGTIEEFHEARPAAGSRTAAPGRTSRTQSHPVASSAARPITDIGTENISRIATGFSEFDRVLGGGIVPGSVTLIAGEPGIGKSTLLLETAGNVARLTMSLS